VRLARKEIIVPQSASNAPDSGRVLVMTDTDVQRAATRIGHEIAERNRGLDGVIIVGLQRGGVWLAEMIGVHMQVGALDVSMYRDDIGLRPVVPSATSNVPLVDGHVVVLVDDVLFTGRTIRAALDSLNDYGRPKAVQLAVMIDRGHRELPIRPDYVGKNLPTSREERVTAKADGVVIEK
jgi:pyrimidine operon attenuation protein / uracil phosphoribosyltransferase